jgi:RNA polymerase subunit RPABC4/transcription elongation factor Spt4
MEDIYCEKCGNLIKKGEMTCSVCGMSLDKTKKIENRQSDIKKSGQSPDIVKCSGCGALISVNSKFCRKCGTIVNKKNDKNKFQIKKIIEASKDEEIAEASDNSETSENDSGGMKTKVNQYKAAFMKMLLHIFKPDRKAGDKPDIKSIGQILKKKTFYKDIISEALHPDILYQKKEELPWYLFILFPVFSYLFLFMQIGLDRVGLGFIEPLGVLSEVIYGLILGIILFFALAFILYIIAVINKKSLELTKLLSCIGISHLLPFNIIFLGFLLRFFTGWSTSVTFGITGVLITLIPILNLIMYIYKNKISSVIINIISLGTVILVGCNTVFFING